ncbi:MAG: AAA family ATPase [Proteobacteria bacterium]|nr:AAA family ATPase [Pseudomonadota bacterium]
MIKSFIIGGLALSYSGLAIAAGAPADLGTLAQSGYLISSPNPTSYPVHKSWKELNSMMVDVTVFNRMVGDIEEVICGADQNKSVLIVGEPSDTYRYIFSKFATKIAASGCEGLAHVEANINKIEAGHSYVGQVEAYWADNILRPVDGKDAVLYFSSLSHLMGVGSHSNDSDGIEKEYASNFTSGRMRTIAYMDKYEYDFYSKNRLSYVLSSFARKITIENIATQDVDQLVKAYLRVLSPGFILNDELSSYLYKTTNYYQPNVSEPQRTLTVLKSLIRSAGALPVETRQKEVSIETPHPYTPSYTMNEVISEPTATSISLSFDSFKTFDSSDRLLVLGAQGQNLETFYGDKGAFTTKAYPTSALTLKFTSNDKDESDGFKIAKVTTTHLGTHVFNRVEVRRAIMEVAQVPRWMIDRDYNVVRDLRNKLDADVVGCMESKNDIERLAKAGYVGGRTDEKPVGSVMLVGPTGTGKSFIAKVMSTAMDMKLVTIDMTSYRTPESFDRFMDIMATNLVLYPYAIYLFEEIDKADPQILDRLYFMVDEGVFYDKFQRPLFARGSFVMMTTNAAENVLLNGNPNDPTVRVKVNEALRAMFRPSFLNRFDAISLFFPFTNAEYQQLATILINKKIKKVRETFDWHLAIDEDSYKYVAVKGRSARYGARPMERLVENVVTVGLAEYQLQIENLEFGAHVSINKHRDGENLFRVEALNRGVNYTVIPDINDGSKLMSTQFARGSMMRKLSSAFEADRMFDDN